MAQLTAETIRRLARDNFDYELAEEAAHAMAQTIGALLALTRELPRLGLQGVEPPFGYPNFIREAQGLAAKGK